MCKLSKKCPQDIGQQGNQCIEKTTWSEQLMCCQQSKLILLWHSDNSSQLDNQRLMCRQLMGSMSPVCMCCMMMSQLQQSTDQQDTACMLPRHQR